MLRCSSSCSSSSLRKKFEELVDCPICWEQFKDPRVFPCLHSCCFECIVKLAEKCNGTLNCPLCRREVEIGCPPNVSSLPCNFIANNILATLALRDDSVSNKLTCDNCDISDPVETRCRKCCKFLCNACTESHRRSRETKSHALLSKEELKANKPADNAKVVTCAQHEEEAIKLYCNTCQGTICLLCSALDHKQHELSSLEESASTAWAELQKLLKDAKSKKSKLCTALQTASEMTREVNERSEKTVNEIERFFTEVAKEIERQKKRLIEKAKSSASRQENELREKIRDLESATSTCTNSINFTEQAIENASDVQILVMKKTITKCLASFNDVHNEVNPTIESPVRFVNDLTLDEIGNKIMERCSVEEVATCPDKCEASLKELESGPFLHINKKSVIEIVCKNDVGRIIKSGGGKDKIEPIFNGAQVSEIEAIENQNGTHEISFVPKELGTVQFKAMINGTSAPGCSLEEDVQWMISDVHGCGYIINDGFTMTGDGEVGKYCYRLGDSGITSGVHKWNVEVSHEVLEGDECPAGSATFEVGVMGDSDEDYTSDSVSGENAKKWAYSNSADTIRFVFVKVDMTNKELTTRPGGKIVKATRSFSVRGKHHFTLTSEKVFPFFSVNCPHCRLTVTQIENTVVSKAEDVVSSRTV